MEILHKAKSLITKEWIEGYIVIYPSGVAEIIEKKEQKPDVMQVIPVDPKTVCVYIGLKDKNKKKIFENDILRLANGAYLRVSWHTFKASWVISKKGWMYNHFFGEAVEPENVEVVGNVFDNPELLERR